MGRPRTGLRGAAGDSSLDVYKVRRRREDGVGERGRVPLYPVFARHLLQLGELHLVVGHAHGEQVEHLGVGVGLGLGLGGRTERKEVVSG